MPGGTPEGGSHLQGAGNPLPQVTQDIDCYYCYSTIIGRRNHTSPSNHRWYRWLNNVKQMFINHEETMKHFFKAIHKPLTVTTAGPASGAIPRNRSCSSRDVSRRGWGDAAGHQMFRVSHVAFRRIGQKQPHTHIYIYNCMILYDIHLYVILYYIMLYYVFRNTYYMITSYLYSHTHI